MNNIKWILTPYINHFNIDDMYDYSDDDDRCLISPIFKNEIINFLEIKKITIFDLNLDDDFQYNIVLKIDKIHFNNISNDLINFETGRFKTTSISINTSLNNWIYLWRDHTFYNTQYFLQ